MSLECHQRILVDSDGSQSCPGQPEATGDSSSVTYDVMVAYTLPSKQAGHAVAFATSFTPFYMLTAMCCMLYGTAPWECSVPHETDCRYSASTLPHLPFDSVFEALVVYADGQVTTLIEPPECGVRGVAALVKGTCFGWAGWSYWRVATCCWRVVATAGAFSTRAACNRTHHATTAACQVSVAEGVLLALNFLLS